MIAVSLGILSHYGLLESGQITELEVKIHCPFHQEDTPSCTIQLEKEFFYCFGCGAKGTLIDFISRLEGKNSLQASIVLSRIVRGVQLDTPTLAKIVLLKEREPIEEATALEQSRVFFFSISKPSWDLIDHHYMLNRGFTTDTLKHFDVKINASAEYPIIVPIRENGKFKGFMTRCLDNRADKYRMSRGMRKSQILSGRVQRGKPVLVVEGQFDLMKCWQNGYPNVASPLNWSVSEIQMDKLNTASAIICATDNDRAGREGYEKLQKMSKVPVVRLRYPSWIKDCGEMPKVELDVAMRLAMRGM